MAELCKSCVHTKVCMKDKNLVGDVFVAGNPMFFDNKELYKKYEERKKAGFPCDDFMSADVAPVRHGRYIGEYDGYADGSPVYDMWYCSECGCYFEEWDEKPTYNYCPNCGADMREVGNEPDP